jgi:hypothetical protein
MTRALALVVGLPFLGLAAPSSAAPPQAPELVPFPHSLGLLDALEGSRRSEARAGRDAYPEEWRGAPAFDPEESVALLDRLLAAVLRQGALLRELRRLAALRLGLELGPQTPGTLARWRGAAAFRARLAALAALADSATFQGHALLSGAPPLLHLFPRPPSGSPQALALVDLSPAAHGLVGLDIADSAAAQAALDLLDTAITWSDAARGHYALAQEELARGTPDGGLRAASQAFARLRELATEATLSTVGQAERALLDSAFQAELARLDRLAAGERFQGRRLLAGGRRRLEGAAGLQVLLELPDMRVLALGLATDITDVDNALDALQLLAAAEAHVLEQLDSVALLRDRLELDVPRRR